MQWPECHGCDGCQLILYVKPVQSEMLDWKGPQRAQGCGVGQNFLMRIYLTSLSLGEESGEDCDHPDGAAGPHGA